MTRGVPMPEWQPAFSEPEVKVHQTEVEAAMASIRGEKSRPPDSNRDLATLRPMLQGMLAGLLLRQVDEGKSLIKIREIDTPVDSNGDYLPYFVVVTGSGLRLRVTVEGES